MSKGRNLKMSKSANEETRKSAHLHAATLGLNRQRIDWEEDEMWGEMAAQGNTPAEKLLHVLAARQLAQKAGFEAVEFESEEITAAKKEKLPYLDIQGAHIMYQVIYTQSSRLLSEALALLVQKKSLLPAEYLPALMDIAFELDVDSELLHQACGKRLIWLAGLRDSWQVYLPVTASVWKTGSHQQRLRWFKLQRKHKVKNSHKLWKEIQKTASSTELIAFLKLLKEGLSSADEDKLEPLLDHRRKEVRTTVFSLLTRIPHTDLAKRMQARAELCFSIENNQVSVTLPNVEKEWERDGFLTFSYAASGLGKKAGYFCHMLACVSPDFWCEKYTISPAEWIHKIFTSEWASATFLAFVIASIRHQQKEWAPILLATLFQQKELLDVVKPNVRVELIQLVAPEKRQELYLKAMSQHDRFDQPYVDFSLVIDHDGMLPEAVALAFYQKLKRTVIRREIKVDQRFRYLLYELPNVALRTPISLYPQIAALFPIELLGDGNYRHYLEEMLQTLDFRYKMHKTFT